MCSMFCARRSSVSLAIRKLTQAPNDSRPQPSAECSKELLLSAGLLRLEATLDKERYVHGETIAVNVLVDNNTSRAVKKIKISGSSALPHQRALPHLSSAR